MSICLVIGGRGALGAAVGERLRSDGWEVLVASSRRGNDADLVINLRQPASFAPALAGLAPLQAVVVAAGLAPTRSLADSEPEWVQQMFEVHVIGPLLFARHAARAMATGSALIFVTSAAGALGSYDPAYASAKAAVGGLTRTLARELAPAIRVNAISPSLVAPSPVHEQMTQDFRDRHLDTSLLHRLASPAECADAIAFLISAAHITGTVLRVDGGQNLGQ